jgi:hypothetical protein
VGVRCVHEREVTMTALLLRHFEKVLAVFAFLCCLAAGLHAAPTGIDEGALEADVELLRACLEGQRERPIVIPPLRARVAAALGTPPPAALFPRWLCHIRPNLVWSVVPPREEILAVQSPPEAFGAAGAWEEGGPCVTLRWSAGRNGALVTVEAYEIWRAEGEGAAARVAELRPRRGETRFAWRDTELRPQRRYSYALRARAHLDESSPELVAHREAGTPVRLAEASRVVEVRAAEVRTPPARLVVVVVVEGEEEDAIATLQIWERCGGDGWRRTPLCRCPVGALLPWGAEPGPRLVAARRERRPHPTIAGYAEEVHVIELLYEEDGARVFRDDASPPPEIAPLLRR